MKKIILFSQATETNRDTILNLIFSDEIKNKVLAYMPSDGANCPQKYQDEWIGYCKKYDTEFRYIDNSLEHASNEAEKLLGANILVISGGNTFTLLNNIRKSGLDQTILKFAQKEEFVIAGFSAGAIVLTPTIEICNLPDFDVNEVCLEDFTGLGLIDFEVFPHFSEDKHWDILENYRSYTDNEVKEITNENYLLIDL